jgi:hypothetical protein
MLRHNNSVLAPYGPVIEVREHEERRLNIKIRFYLHRRRDSPLRGMMTE